MKYSKSTPPLVCMQTQSTCYRGTGTMNVLGVLWHCTGANNPTLKRYVQPSDNAADRDEWLALLGKNTGRNDWNHIKIDAGLNAWIGQLADGTVTGIQTMPWDYRPWGCGSGYRGSCNWGWIQFEMCEDDLNGEEYFEDAYTEACEITAYLCALYDIDPLGYVNYEGVQVPTILCHNDSASLGLGTWHADVYNWVRDRYGKTMDDVRNDVASILSGGEPIPTPEPTPEPIPQPDTGTNTIQAGDVVRILPGSVYYKTDKLIPDWVLAKDWVVSAVDKNRVVLGKSVDGKNNINSPVRYDYLEIVTDNTPETVPNPEPSPEGPSSENIQVGSAVTIKAGAVYYTGAKVPEWILPIVWTVKSLEGSRAVLGASTDGEYSLNSPIDIKYLNLVKGNEPSQDESIETPGAGCTIHLDILSNGSQGAQVKTLQQLLAAKGYQPGQADGIMGPITVEAVKKFQRAAGLLDDAIVGGDTWTRLIKG